MIIDTGVGEKCTVPSGLLHEVFVSGVSFDLWQNRPGFRDQSGHGSHVAGVIWQQLQSLNRKQEPSLCMLRAGYEKLPVDSLVKAFGHLHSLRARGYQTPVVLCAFALDAAKTDPAKFKKFEEVILAELKRGTIIVSATDGRGMDLDQLKPGKVFLPGCLRHENLLTVALSSKDGLPAPRGCSGKEKVFCSAEGTRLISCWKDGSLRAISGSSQASAVVAATVFHLHQNKESIRIALKKNGSRHPGLLGQTASEVFFVFSQSEGFPVPPMSHLFDQLWLKDFPDVFSDDLLAFRGRVNAVGLVEPFVSADTLDQKRNQSRF